MPTLTLSLTPSLRTQIKVRLEQDLALKTQIEELEAHRALVKSEIEELFVQADAADALLDGTEIDGIKVKLVAGGLRRGKFDPKRLMEQNPSVTMAQITAAYGKSTPVKSSLRITHPGEQEREDR